MPKRPKLNCRYEHCQKGGFKVELGVLQHMCCMADHPRCVRCMNNALGNDVQAWLHHLEISHAYCRICSILYASTSNLELHYRISQLHPSCKQCLRGFKDDTVLHAHVRSAHTPSTSTRPSTAIKTSPISAPSTTIIICPRCPGDVILAGRLEDHYLLSLNHRNCQACMVGFKDEDAYEGHMQAMHAPAPIPMTPERVQASPDSLLFATETQTEGISHPGSPFTDVAPDTVLFRSPTEDSISDISPVSSAVSHMERADDAGQDANSTNTSTSPEIVASQGFIDVPMSNEDTTRAETSIGAGLAQEPVSEMNMEAKYHMRFFSGCGHAVFLVEDLLFKVDRFFFHRDSSYLGRCLQSRPARMSLRASCTESRSLTSSGSSPCCTPSTLISMTPPRRKSGCPFLSCPPLGCLRR